MNDLQKAVLKTVCYAEVFSFPLTLAELHKYLVYNKKVTKQEILLAIHCSRDSLSLQQEYITFNNTKHLISIRKKRMQLSKRKYAKALFISQVLSYIPTIKLIGVSGSLSMLNAKAQDDIDLFFVTSKHSVWISRFLVNLVLVCMRQKRDRMHAITKDKICPNMFLSETSISLPKTLRNIYVAHEVAQLKVVYAKDNMDKRFFYANRWVLRYLPHAFHKPRDFRSKRHGFSLLAPLEALFFLIQFLYMKKRITNEKIGYSYAFFHPRKNDQMVSKIYSLKVSSRVDLVVDVLQKKQPSSIHALN